MFIFFECAACLLVVVTVLLPAFTVLALLVALDEGVALAGRLTRAFVYDARILVAIRDKLSAIRFGRRVNGHEEVSEQ